MQASKDAERDSVVKVVASIWSEVLGIEIPHPEDDFFRLGGDSLAALAVSKRLTELGGGSWPEDGIVSGALSYVSLWQHRTVDELAGYLVSSEVVKSWPASALEGVLLSKETGEDSDDPDQPAHQKAASVQDRRPSAAETGSLSKDHRELRNAAARGMLAEMRLLLSAGVHPSGGEGREAPLLVGVTALHAAANAGQAAAVEELLARGGNANAKMFFYKRTPSHCAAAAGCLDALKALHAAGGALRAKDKSRLSVMHDAARGGSAACVRWLLEAGGAADLNARDKWGRTPLHWCVLNGNTEAARVLLEAGAEAEPGKMPHRIQRRRTSLAQPPSLASLARQFHAPDHPLHALLNPPTASAASSSPRRPESAMATDASEAAARHQPAASSDEEGGRAAAPNQARLDQTSVGSE